MKAGVCVLILNWNNWRDTTTCLESVFQGSHPDCRVVVVDNASTDGSEERIKEWAAGGLRAESRFFQYDPGNKPVPYVRYDRQEAEGGGDPEREKSLCTSPAAGVRHPLVIIQSGGNLGYAGGNNVGMRYALSKDDCRYIWLLNNDTVVDGDALAEMLRCAEAGEGAGMVGSKLLYHDRPETIQAAGGCTIAPWAGNASVIASNEEDRGRWDAPLEPSYVSGASLLVRREVVEAIGLMDEEYFLYWEDADWGVRARRKGYRLLYCPRSRVWHREGGAAGYLSFEADYYWVRNGLYFTKKFYPYFLPLVPFSYLAKHTLVRMLKRQPLHLRAYARGVADFLRGKVGPM